MNTNPTATTSDLITEAMRLLATPVELPADIAPEDVEIALRDALRAQLASWLDACSSKLAALYHLHCAARSRADVYAAESERWARLAWRERDTAAWAQERAGDLLVAERRVSGFDEGDAYVVMLPSGVKPGWRLNPPSVEVFAPEAVPAELLRPAPPAPPPAPDKVAIKAVLAAGREVPGCRLVRGQRFDWGEPRRASR